jgi:molybdopterin-guanine dinucleotide biosynthesis protein A
MTEQVTAIVLAGGRSTRMGRDKAALVLGGRTLLQRAIDAAGAAAGAVVVVGAPGRALPPVTSPVPITLLTDPEEGAGPLAGIVAGMAAVRTPVAVVLACDMPFVEPALLRLLVAAVRERAPSALPVVEGQAQPLCSAVRTDALTSLRAVLASGTRAAAALADLPGARLLAPAEWGVADSQGISFVGVNTPEEWARAEALDAARTRDG